MLTCISSVLPLPVAHPERELVELRPWIAGDDRTGRPVSLIGSCVVVRGDRSFRSIASWARVAEVAVEVDLGEQQRQVLEVLPGSASPSAGDRFALIGCGVGDDVLVVLLQQRDREFASGWGTARQAHGGMVTLFSSRPSASFQTRRRGHRSVSTPNSPSTHWLQHERSGRTAAWSRHVAPLADVQPSGSSPALMASGGVEHQPVEVLLDEAHLPRFVAASKVLEVVVAVDVDEVELAVPAPSTAACS